MNDEYIEWLRNKAQEYLSEPSYRNWPVTERVRDALQRHDWGQLRTELDASVISLADEPTRKC
jgi:hypothetical protein